MMPGFIELEKLATMAKNDMATGGKDSHEKASGHREDQRDAVQFSACRWGGGRWASARGPYMWGEFCKLSPRNSSGSVSQSVQSLSHVWLFVTPWTAARQASLSITNFWSLSKLMSIKLVMPSNHLILCHPLLLLPSIFPSIRVFSNESALHIHIYR